MKKILITAGDVSLPAVLNESRTAAEIWQALPFTGKANTWGDEIYFSIPVSLGEESDARADVEVGELGYWPTGSAFCIFFGPTPVSSGSKPRAASPVNVFGKVEGDAALFRSIPHGTEVLINKIE